MPPKKKVKTESGPKPAAWEFQDDDGNWVEYDEVDSIMLEKSHAVGTTNMTTTDFSFNKGHGSKYVVDFTGMSQKNEDSGKIRKIRRKAPPGCWEWLDDYGLFVQFYDEDNAMIEKAYQATGVGKEFRTKALTFNKDFDSPYVFNFKTAGADGDVSGTQKNEDSGKEREIRRQKSAPKEWDTSKYGIKGATEEAPASPAQGGFAYPAYWTKASGEVDMVTITSGKEYDDVVSHFKKTLGIKKVTIHKVERIQNYTLYRFYEMTRQHIASRNKGDANELILFHGARVRANMDAIMQFGFDMRVAANGSCGTGIYFAVNSSYSNCGYVLQNSDKSKEMFLCRVACGSHTQGAPGLRRPPPKDASKPTGDLYDSVTNGKPPIMHVVFNNWQAYPEYLVKYTA